MEEDIKILEEYLENLQYIGNTIIMSDEIVKVIDYKEIKALENLLKRYKELEEENALLKHRLEVANEFIESRQEVLIPENYEDLKYILNECDLESTW